MVNVGGGLAVDYDGSQTDSQSSANYTLQEYANDVVHYVRTVCDDAGVAHPDIVSESGRAIAAYHSVLIVELVGQTGPGGTVQTFEGLPALCVNLLTKHNFWWSLTTNGPWKQLITYMVLQWKKLQIYRS